MIETNTVFILGAGANIPYGYPSGAALRNAIIVNNIDHYRTIVKDLPHAFTTLFQNFEDFRRTFKNSSTPSIDLFLARNHHYRDIGKFVILANLLTSEGISKFREESHIPEQDWYSFLFNQMTKTLTDPEDFRNFGNNKVTFITFNYDRSLEFFLLQSLANSFQAAHEDEIIAEVNKIDIHHVYGRLPDLTHESDNGLPYALARTAEHKLSYSSFIENAERIKVIYDRQNGEYEDVLSKISEAKRVFFLGFGFAEENIERLKLDEIISYKQQIYGTAYGLFDSEISGIRRTLQTNYQPMQRNVHTNTNKMTVENTDCLTLLRKYL